MSVYLPTYLLIHLSTYFLYLVVVDFVWWWRGASRPGPTSSGSSRPFCLLRVWARVDKTGPHHPLPTSLNHTPVPPLLSLTGSLGAPGGGCTSVLKGCCALASVVVVSQQQGWRRPLTIISAYMTYLHVYLSSCKNRLVWPNDFTQWQQISYIIVHHVL